MKMSTKLNYIEFVFERKDFSKTTPMKYKINEQFLDKREKVKLV